MDTFTCPKCGHTSTFDPWIESARCPQCGYVPQPGDHLLRADEASDGTENGASAPSHRPGSTWRSWTASMAVSIALLTPAALAIYWLIWQADPATPIRVWTHALVVLGFVVLANGLRLVQVREGIVTTSRYSVAGALLLTGALSAMARGEDRVTHLGRSWIGHRFLVKGLEAVVIGLLRIFTGLGLILVAYVLRVLQIP